MGKWIRGTVWLVTAWMLVQNLFLWGGLALTPGIGPQLREQANVQSPLVATYAFLGRRLIGAVGQEDRAVAHVARRFPDQVTDTDSPPQTVVPRFLAAQSAGEALDHYGAPLMLVLSLVLHARRQKPIRSFGVRD
jgi:hypothetical protein